MPQLKTAGWVSVNKAPIKDHLGEKRERSIQKVDIHAATPLNKTPTNGDLNRRMPSAKVKPCAGGYLYQIRIVYAYNEQMNYGKLINESVSELEVAEKNQPLVRNEKRIQFLKFLKSGEAETQAEAGKKVGWQLRQSQKIWQLYRTGGLAAALAKTDNRGFGKLSAVEISRLNSYLTEFGAKSLAEIQQYLENSGGVSYSIGGLSDLCLRLKIKLKTARPRNYRQNAAAVETYKKTSGI